MTPEQEYLCLQFYPYEGDRDLEVIQLSDLFRRAGKYYATGCMMCCGPIEKGERHRILTEILVGEAIGSFRFCAECCIAMATEEEYHANWATRDSTLLNSPVELRTELGIKRSGENRNI